ncbi:MAG: XrtA-associated tyrosine autokinase [Janthinobacterium lividum]
MSIIEKAAGRLDKGRNEAPPTAPLIAEAELVAAAQARVELPAAAPVAPAVIPASKFAMPSAYAKTVPVAPAAAPAAPAPRLGPASDGAGNEQVVAAAVDGLLETPSPAVLPLQKGSHVDINMALLERLGIVTPGMGRTPVAEEFRMIKRPLLQNAFKQDASKRHSNLIMVTSSLPGEGKTFCSINLAMSIAMEMDHTVLLVDADVARPSVLRTLGLEARPGLMDVLLDDTLELSDVMLRTNVDTLRILPAGRLHPNATELLASLSMSNLLDQIAQRYPDRIVIFDSPPLLLTSESKALASNMGQIVLVVEAETTTQHALKDAIRRLGATSNVSLIYNKTKAFTGDGAYGYGYN